MLTRYGLLCEIIYENINQFFSPRVSYIYSFNNKNFVHYGNDYENILILTESLQLFRQTWNQIRVN